MTPLTAAIGSAVIVTIVFVLIIGSINQGGTMRKLSIRQATTITAIIVFTAIAVVAAPVSAVELEPGATFNGDGTCMQDGEAGLSMADGQCVTAADYDILFSYDSLSEVESQIPAYAGRSVADVYLIDPVVPASLRMLGIGLVEPFTFIELVNGLVIM